MKNFIELKTKEGIQFVNINHILKVSTYKGNENDTDKCFIIFAVANSKNNSGMASMFSIENYDEVILKIKNAI